MTGNAENSSRGAPAKEKHSSTWKIIFQKSHIHLLFLISFRPTLQVLPFLLFFLPRATTLPNSLSVAILRYRPTANTGSRIIARKQTRNVMRIEVSLGFRFSPPACWSILIRKPKTIWTAGDNMPYRETARVYTYICIHSIDARTLFVESLELWDSYRVRFSY